MDTGTRLLLHIQDIDKTIQDYTVNTAIIPEEDIDLILHEKAVAYALSSNILNKTISVFLAIVVVYPEENGVVKVKELHKERKLCCVDKDSTVYWI